MGNRTRACTLGVALLLGMGGCQMDIEEETAISASGDPRASFASLDGHDGRLQGSLGAFDGFSAEAYRIQVFDYGDSSEVTLHAGTDYWVMTSLSLGAPIEDLRPGTRLSYSQSEYDEADPIDVSYLSEVFAIGCSGPSEEELEYDVGAETVEVEVSQGSSENERVMDFTATFTDGEYGPQTVHGSFGYTVD